MTRGGAQPKAGFINKHEARCVKFGLPFKKRGTLAHYILTVLLVRDRSFFLWVQPIFFIAIDIDDDATRRPLSFSHASIRSMSRASG